jgi:AraC family transcriptional activator of tynA and feaB
VENFTTATMPVRDRTAIWNRLFAEHFEPALFQGSEASVLSAEFATGDLGPLRLGRLLCSDVTLQRGSLQIGIAGARSYTILLQAGGASTFHHYGQSVTMREGELSLCDSGAPYRLDMAEGSELLLVRVPAALLRRHLPSPEGFCGKLLSNDAGLTYTAAAMILSLVDRIEEGFARHYEDRIARHLLDMIATSYAIAFDAASAGSSIVTGRHATVKLHIEQHLRDPDLNPCSIAARMKLSARYLRMIFATSNETVSAYILRRRLEECARQIADPSWRGHSMTEIAFGWGFNSAPHFTRSFRERYQMAPRDYRRLKLGDGGAAPARNSPSPRAAFAGACAA